MAGKKNGAVSFLVATFILAAALTLAQDNGHPSATLAPPAEFKNPTTTAHTAAPTTAAPTTTAHTAAPNTTTHTAAPNTTTHTAAPNTTTHTAAPNTTTPDTPTNTTVHPNTTTTPTTSPPKPTPPANLTLGTYTIKDGSKVCIMLQAAIQINVNNSKVQGTFNVQPNQTQTYGSCKSNTGKIKLSFNQGIIVLAFLKNDTTKMVYATSVVVNLTYAFKSGESYSISKTNTSVQLFSMKASHSYSCKSEKVNMGDGISLEFSQERLQAFDFGNNGQFGPIDLCKADQPNYNVAIAVGIVLIVLIIIVVIAYLLSRRKRTDGYQTL
ncbi:lysosome-associated membrane glycoprotein 1 [Salminus brasiliensis]|uniref:lysosome-associated membrane glycoprotein 1 n=1 Tax=Salminus brasiliensis TaxID=930266 RepID=UPI003B83532C